MAMFVLLNAMVRERHISTPGFFLLAVQPLNDDDIRSNRGRVLIRVFNGTNSHQGKIYAIE